MAGRTWEPSEIERPRFTVIAGSGFRPEFFDFDRGIRVGNLEPHERITQILKRALESAFGQTFTTVRWGRGVYWQWIGFFPQANRLAKPLSHHVSFGCAKYFISLERDDNCVKAGMQVERGYLRAPRQYPECRLREDWDWHRLLAQLRSGSELDHLLRQLVTVDGFHIYAGGWPDGEELTAARFTGATQVRRLLLSAPSTQWGGFQLYYPMTQNDVRSMTGYEIVESILAIFGEVTPVLNRCMQIRLQPCSRHGGGD
ncbi:MAG TPA: hypothetical protein VNM72_01975 [Blastocatellia bacterium]|nr:hypothetical protein [Blastocatellia bacterium]